MNVNNGMGMITPNRFNSYQDWLTFVITNIIILLFSVEYVNIKPLNQERDP